MTYYGFSVRRILLALVIDRLGFQLITVENVAMEPEA